MEIQKQLFMESMKHAVQGLVLNFKVFFKWTNWEALIILCEHVRVCVM